MKLIKARSSCAPAPISTAKRAPEILVARSKSITPSCGPRSQCALGSKSNLRASPHVRTTTLSAALFPTGTLACGTLGSVSSRIVRCRSALSSSTSSCLIFCPRILLASKRWLASCPCLLARATSSPDAFCSRFNPSICGIRRRRCVSAVANCCNSAVTSRPRLASPFCTASRLSRTKAGSSIGMAPLEQCLAYSIGVSVKIRKAVFPAAGLGTRFLPATKALPKEMLPLVDKPTIQYGVEEASASGVPNIVVVTGRGKHAIEDHFDVSTELEAFLESRGKRDLANEVRKISELIKISYVRQGE